MKVSSKKDGVHVMPGPGHMFFVTSDGKQATSCGFAPITHEQINGPGRIYNSDADEYHKPAYSRTME
ncbi:hypothetical protein [Xanthomonas bromi]|uniref:hypothetical protein n=1 Tax=Xanthomonas bromi TaxID=56449 RepID=UPI001111D883|nr:hypothetical protein [Xanthomonas bromi]